MSLLTNPWFTAGMGLLANSGPSLTPVNPWRGIGQDLMAANEAKAMEAQQAYEAQRMAVEKQKYDQSIRQQQYIDQLADQETDPQMAAMARAAPDEYIKRKMAPAPASVHISTAGDLGLQGYSPNTPVEVKTENGQIIDYTPMPPPAPQTSGIQLQGPNGQQMTASSVEDANRLLQSGQGWNYYKPPPTTQIDMGAGDRASPSDVANMIYPDSSPVLPGTPWPEIIAKGGRTLTGEEKAARTATGTQGAKDEQAAAKGGNLFDNYTTAAGAYQSGVMPAGEAREQAKVARRALVTWYAKNVLGTPGAEPSPALYDKAEEIIPDFAGPWDTAMFSARMEEIKQTIGASLGGKKQDQGMKDIELIYDPVLKRLVPAK